MQSARMAIVANQEARDLLHGIVDVNDSSAHLKTTISRKRYIFEPLEREDHMLLGQEPEIVQALRKHPDGATIEMLAQMLKLTEGKVRDRIDSARYGRGKYNIARIGDKTFQLKPGTWRGRRK